MVKKYILHSLSPIISIFICQFFLLSYVNGLDDVELQSNLYIVNSYLIAILALSGWFRSVDYNNLKLKLLILFEIIYLSSEIVSFGLFLLGLGELFAIVKAFAFSAWLYYIFYRSSKNKNSKLNNKDIFAVRLKPKSFQDTLIAMFGFGLGGYGIYYNGSFYHFRKGTLIKENEKILKATKNK